MQLIRKIFFLFVIAISIIIIREFIALYNDLYTLGPYWAYAFLAVALFVLVYFALLPLLKIVMLPKSFAPTKDKSETETLLRKRVKAFEKNPHLKHMALNESEAPEQTYKKGVLVLENKVDLVRKDYIAKIFYSTAVSQNGFLDALIILSASINLVKEIFIIYNGRVTNKDLLTIGRKIYTAMAIGGSEGVEYATDEIIASLASDGMKSIPFIDKIMGSIADGFVNAMLITRLSYITENYCKLVYIKNEKELLPSFRVVYDTTKLITNDVRERIKGVLKNMATDKQENFARFAVNPAAYVINLAVNTIGATMNTDGKIRNNISNAIRIASNPLAYGFDKIAGLFSKKNNAQN